MDAVLSRLKGLSADELREEILKANLKCGPITATTRAIFERKLARTLVENAGVTEPDSNGASVGTGDSGSVMPAKQPPSATSASPDPDCDFGYGLGLNPPEEEGLMESSGMVCSSNVENSMSEAQTPSKTAQTSPTFFYGVCPLWEDVLARNERAHVYTDKREALQAVKMMKGARFKAFSNREDAEKFAKGICDYYPSPCKSTPCVSPIKPGLVFGKDHTSLVESDTINREKANSFKSPRTQDLTAKLRKAVEKGDEMAFSELVWSNPRYLIGSGDNPSVVQEGCRYNVMHVAAKENQPGIVQLLLDTLENPDFMRLMYPDDPDSMLQKRIRYIVDLYLNTPDKAGFETPLHFACKFGCPDVVNILCSHPDIDKNCKNKYNQKPSEVVCERMREKGKCQEIRQKINEYLEDRLYIPLLRATDNSSQPVIGAPWSPEPMENLSPWLPRSPMDPIMAVRAFAGPLSPSNADEFRRAWKTPPRERADHFHNILKSDPDRGAERVGRDLAHELGHPWAEYWDFLDSFVDLSSAEGLKALEEYLSKKDFRERAHEEAGENEASNRFKTPSPGKLKKFCNSISVGAFLDESDDISLEEIKNRQNAALTSISSVCSKDGLQGAVGGIEFHILPVSHNADLIEAAAEQDLLLSEKSLISSSKNGLCEHGPGDGTPNGDKMSPRICGASNSCMLSPISNLMAEFERMSLHDDLDRTNRDRRRSGGKRHRDAQPTELTSGLGRLSLSSEDDSVFEKGRMSLLRAVEKDGVETRNEDDARSSASSGEYFLASERLDFLKKRSVESPGGERTICARSKSWDHGGRDLSSSGSSSSYRSLDSSQDFILRTPPRVTKRLYIEGDSPTKLDREVLLALGTTDVDPSKYPIIHKWKSTVQIYSQSEMQSWQTPAVCKSHFRAHPVTPGSPASSLMSPTSRFSPARHVGSPDFCSPGRYSPAHSNYSPVSYIQRIRLKHYGDAPI
ncbi:ankyrin repeat and LEM domain-containing protein 2 [Triplophysa rosa]|uniref:Ankyrin repeat and LEM domain-containing protein 2 n=1 Tax=Triplophysa rosa TaxID=992332 RepID=A0A9W7X3T5_TRIRA|nr:ankyrin repeat and LEM domain-containing protein 2 [Triplophysa rosa]XP_057181675.1 ankyrin repeat and LEM domain-containing protein 2 [Triplophysa rosa]XP_057181684.1 ankyrin repeat and LEM domain-containing protein 2 [Triplophysa rosa]XP_057181693.1 ankyrin repeat and LEM domain-containing protein 2 [Triplophysa rosa]KAI7813234.1 ankyrin repeat and LEM domain-containing protein 2 [Triplophysa rosa]